MISFIFIYNVDLQNLAISGLLKSKAKKEVPVC